MSATDPKRTFIRRQSPETGSSYCNPRSFELLFEYLVELTRLPIKNDVTTPAPEIVMIMNS